MELKRPLILCLVFGTYLLVVSLSDVSIFFSPDYLKTGSVAAATPPTQMGVPSRLFSVTGEVELYLDASVMQDVIANDRAAENSPRIIFYDSSDDIVMDLQINIEEQKMKITNLFQVTNYWTFIVRSIGENYLPL